MQNNPTEQDLMEYLPLVEKAARNVKVKSAEYELADLVNIGFIGLMDAANKYDPAKKVPFENYAYIRIKGSIIDEVRKHGKVPRSQIQKLNDYYKAKETLEDELQREPTELEICQKLGIDEKQLSNIHQTVISLANVSLNDLLFDDESDGASRMDFVQDDEVIGADEKLLKEEEIGYLEEAIGELKERDQLVLQLIYKEELQLKEIAYILDVSVPRVSQIHSKALMTLREKIKKAGQ